MSTDPHYSFERILVERRPEGVTLFTLDRPERMNSTDTKLHTELSQFGRLLDRDEATRVAVVTGAGKAFSVGGDYGEIAQQGGQFDYTVNGMRETIELLYGMIECRKPIVSAINGPAAGAGLALALLADVSVANEDAFLSDGHTRIGLAAGDHAALIWPLLCGMAKAKLYLLSSRKISGREAERIGLVSVAVPADAVLEEALSIAQELATRAPLALELTKRSLNHWLRTAMPAFESSLAYEIVTAMDPEMAKQVQAMLAKKK